MSINRASSTGLLWLSIAVVWFVPSSTIPARGSPFLKPNILIILTDDQGRGDYSAFRTRDLRTPNMDRLFPDNTIRGLVRCTTIACFTLGIAPEIMPA
jgi:hypothetical protein